MAMIGKPKPALCWFLTCLCVAVVACGGGGSNDGLPTHAKDPTPGQAGEATPDGAETEGQKGEIVGVQPSEPAVGDRQDEQQEEKSLAAPTETPTHTSTPMSEPDPDKTGLADLKELLFIAGATWAGGGCFGPPSGVVLPAVVAHVSNYYHGILCLWGFSEGEKIAVDLYDPTGRLAGSAGFVAHQHSSGPSRAAILLSLAGQPTGEWTVIATAPGARVKGSFLAAEPEQPVLSILPRNWADPFGGARWLSCSENTYRAGEWLTVFGAGLPANEAFPMGMYHVSSVDGSAQLVHAEIVTADERGRFVSHLLVEPTDPAGRYYALVQLSPDYRPLAGVYDPKGAIACLEVPAD